MTSDTRIGILGPLEVWAGAGDRVEVVGPRLRTLLVRLALDPGRVVLGTQLVDAVWGEEPPAGAANALQSLVSRLRRLLPPGTVESHPAGYRLALDPDAVDAVRFERLALAGRESLSQDPGRAGEVLREALALWRGPALADAAAAGFAAAAVARLDALRLDALEDRIEADLRGGEGPGLVAELDELVAAHPLRERLSGQLMRALARAARQADALATYERIRERLADALGIDPSEELKRVHLGVLRGEAAAPAAAVPADAKADAKADAAADASPPEPRSAPAAAHAERPPRGERAAPAARTNLRAQISSFVGRDGDIARIGAALDGARLVTLTGPGGAGKTRLASEVAARLLDRLPDGVWMAELAPVADPADLPQAVLSLLGAREAGLLPTRAAGVVAAAGVVLPPIERLVEALAGKRLLLVMDNCEHLVADAAALIDLLLARCPDLRVLATSREPLGITGEVLHPVGPLALPGGAVEPGAALRYPAVRLFADRGAAVRPAFRVDHATVRPVLRICRALDGIPLAIELAAARLSALTPEQIAGRLDDRFRLLASGGRPVTPRHQTLRAVIDWSWDLLDEDERTLLRRLAVFAGGATLAAAERVCAGPALGGLARDEVLYLLAALVDKSLAVAGDGERADGTRYVLLETIRAYGEERHRAAGEGEALRRAHAECYLDLAERAEPHLRGRDQLVWIERLTAERDNLHAALRWAVDGGHTELALRLVCALGWYWFLRSARAEGTEWADKALALPGPAPEALRAQVMVIRAFIPVSSGVDIDQARVRIDEARTIAEGLPPDEPRLRHPLLAVVAVLAAILRGDDAGARDQVRPLADHPDPWMRAAAHLIAGQFLINLGEAAEAEAELRLGLAGFRALGERWGMGQALVALAELGGSGAGHDAAIAALDEAREVFTGLGDRDGVGQLLLRTAQEHAKAGRFDQARDDLDEVSRIAYEVGAEDQKLWIRRMRADLARWQGRLVEARELLDDAVSGVRVGGPFDPLRALVMASRGHVEVELGELDDAEAWYGRAIRVALAGGDRPVIARVVELRAAVALARGDAEESAALLGTAEVLRGSPDEADLDVVRVRAAALAALGAEGFAQAYRRGAARRRDDVLETLAAALGPGLRPGDGTPAARAG